VSRPADVPRCQRDRNELEGLKSLGGLIVPRCQKGPRCQGGRVDHGQLTTLQRQNAENLKQIFPEKDYRGLSPNFHIHASVSELYIPTMGKPFLLEEICGPILGIYKYLTDT
jgi:hypothetical protein